MNIYKLLSVLFSKFPALTKQFPERIKSNINIRLISYHISRTAFLQLQKIISNRIILSNKPITNVQNIRLQ